MHMIHIFATNRRGEQTDLEQMVKPLAPRNKPDTLSVVWNGSSENNDCIEAHTPLSLALEKRKWKLAELLLDSGTTLSPTFVVGPPLLEAAVRDMESESVKILLGHGAMLTENPFRLQEFHLLQRQSLATFRWELAIDSMNEFKTMLGALLEAGFDINGRPEG